MARRAPAGFALFTLISAAILTACGGELACGADDGLFVDYDSGCHDYVRCENGSVRARYSCGPGRSFSGAAGACVERPLSACVRHTCAPYDSSAYAAPGTACREYYRCENGTARDLACPPGAWFDSELQGCTRGAGACYEPICGGLRDGYHWDPSHDCRRRIRCRAAELRAVVPCVDGEERCPKAPDRCPAPRSMAAAIPVGNAHFCSDEACTSLCQLEEDGAHADRASGCREYFVCASRRVVRRGVCDAGRLFSSLTSGCEPAATVSCPPALRGRCFGRADGAYRDWRDCRSWFACRRERVLARGSCDANLVWDGTTCVPPSRFLCEGPTLSSSCSTQPSGFYQDLESNCARYYHCEGLWRTNFSCPFGRVFDGASCVRAADYLCPSLDQDSCYGKADGKYRARSVGCRGYYTCVAGYKSWHACAPGLAFDAVKGACVDSLHCTNDDYICEDQADGYHRDEESGCRNYFYCEGGERLATLTCFGSKLFDGHACVDPSQYTCGEAPAGDDKGETEGCKRNGFSVLAGSDCRMYSVCIDGVRNTLRCPQGELFNGARQVCVSAKTYTCPGG